MKLEDLSRGKLAVLGLGREGWATLEVIARRFPGRSVTVVDDRAPDAPERERLGRLELDATVRSPISRDTLRGLEILVKSPGVSLYRPEIQAALREGVEVTSATNLWFAEMAGERTIVVTGTKGKSTTASLIHHLLAAKGIRAELAGNIGRPLLEALLETFPGMSVENPPDPPPAASPGSRRRIQPEGPTDEPFESRRGDTPGKGSAVHVIELSSYQIADLDHAPTIGVLLNLHPEHLDWHGTVERYFRDKTRLFRLPGDCLAVLNREDASTRELVGEPEPCLFFNDPAGVHVAGDDLFDGAERLGPAGTVPLLGAHNRSNACAAIAAAKAAGLSPARAFGALASFRGLPHRLAALGDIDDRLYVDDSISTTPESAVAALRSFPDRPVTILLGGHDRGVSYRILAEELAARPEVTAVLMPDNGERIAGEIEDALARASATQARPTLHRVADLSEGVDLARRITPEGGVILLSPAAPSFGRFRDYRERGEAFARCAGLGTD